MNQIHLSRAYLCANCSTVSDDSRTCPACGDGSLLALSRVLARESSSEAPAGLWRAVSELEQALSAQ